MKLRNLTLEGRVLSAPLAGISSSAYRLLARRHGAALVVSEMISAEGLIRGSRKTVAMLRLREPERPVSIQLFGCRPDVLSEACRIVEANGADMIDLNFGCPARKIVNKCGGAALLKDVGLAASLFQAAVNSVSIPVSVKFRSGWDSESNNYIEIGKLAEDSGISMLTLHPRTRACGFRGKSDWQKIHDLKEAVKIPVVGNGDIWTPEDAIEMMKQTDCDLVMIGRAALGAPWIFRRVDSVLRGLPDPGDPTFREKSDVCLEFARLLIEDVGERTGVLQMRKHLAWFTSGWEDIGRFRSMMFSITQYSDITDLFDEYLGSRQKQIA
jgi:nifR3 family TIM-barrel protein